MAKRQAPKSVRQTQPKQPQSSAPKGKRLSRGKVDYVNGLPDAIEPRADWNFAAVLEDRKDIDRGTGEAVASALSRGLPTIRKLTRNATRMNGIASRPGEVTATMVIGEGMVPLCSNRKVMKHWKNFTHTCAAEGYGDFRFLQEILWKEFFNIGEAYLEFRDRKGARWSHLTVPFQLQPIPSEMVPVVNPKQLGALEGLDEKVVYGMVYDKFGDVTHYYRYINHPGDRTNYPAPTGQELKKVKAADFLHVMKQNEIGAHRGESSLSKALVRIHDLEKYLGAELLKKVLAANVAYWLEMPDLTPEEKERLADVFEDPETGLFFNSAGEEVEKPKNYDGFIASKDGSVKVLPPGGKMNVSAPAESGSSFAPFIRAIGMYIAMSTNIPYEYLFMDVAGLQDRIYKGISQQFERQVNMWRADFTTMCLVPIWNRFITELEASGKWVPEEGETLEDYLNIEWAGQPFPNLHRAQEVSSWGQEMDLNIATESDIIRRQGDSPERVRMERLSDMIANIQMGLAEPPLFWSDKEIKERVGWDDARIKDWRALSAPAQKPLSAAR